MFRAIKKLSISRQMFFLIFICITVIMTLFTVVVTSVLQRYLVDMAVKISNGGASFTQQSMESVYTTSEEYVLLLAADSRLQQSMQQYKMDPSATSKNNASNVAAKTFSSTRLFDTLSGAVLLDTERNFIYTNSFFREGDITEAISEDMCDKAFLLSRPIWGMELISLTENWGPGLHMAADPGGEKECHVLLLYKVLRNVDSGEFLGYIVLFVDENAFASLYAEANRNTNNCYYLVGNDRKIISSSNRDSLGDPLPEELTWMLEKSTNVLREGGKPVQYISTKIRSRDQWLLQIVKMDDLESQKVVLWVVASGCIVGLIFALSLSALRISTRVAKPIIELAEVMETIEGSTDLPVRVDVRQWGGEQAILARGFNNLMERLQKAMDDIYHQQREKRKIEIQLLQEQINPHFLYNTLETISSLVMLNMNDKAMDLCSHLSDFYKTSLSSGNNIITLEEEFLIAEDYLSIQSIRYVDYMEYSIECDPAVMECYVPKFLIQPLIENAIYHGLKQKNSTGMILVTGQCDETESRIIVNVIDTGTGIQPDKLKEMNVIMEQGKISPDSFGLSNIAARLRHFFGGEGKISITSTPGIATNVQIEFPMIRTKEELEMKWRK